MHLGFETTLYLEMYLGEKIVETNKAKLPTKGVRKKIDFNKEGKKGNVTASNTSKVEDKI